MAVREKNEVKNIWLSENCAGAKCSGCPERKEFGDSTHICLCRCHTRVSYSASPIGSDKK